VINEKKTKKNVRKKKRKSRISGKKRD
jgi:hypothetical protein